MHKIQEIMFSNEFVSKQLLAVGVLAVLVVTWGFRWLIRRGTPSLNFCGQALDLVRVMALRSTPNGRLRKVLLYDIMVLEYFI